MKQLGWSALYGISAFLVALTLAWIILASTNFWYGLWHDVGGIAEGIERWAPENRFKPGFADTTREQRIELFSEIVVAIHNHGEGLANIRYETPGSQGMQALLREPEIIHLQDVANLIDVAKFLAVVFALIWIAMLASLYRQKQRLYRLTHQIGGVGGLLGLLAAAILIFGAETVFYTLHIWIFPAEHQWFFYYQDSLMSTMMLAPVLFAWIAAALVVLALAIYGVLQVGCNFLLLRQSSN